MNTKSIKIEKKIIEEKYGEWTAHNFLLYDGIFTMKNVVVGDEIKIRRVLQVVSDISSRPLSELRVLDLACLEGGYSIEFARMGSRVCAIEGRTANIEKARFAAQVLNLKNIDFYKDDVRNLNVSKYGTFDVVLCLGILYHLDVPDLFHFIESLFSVCTHFLVIDTHISLKPETPFSYGGQQYWGKTVVEHPPDSTPEQVQKRVWSSLDNPQSVYLTRSSLLRLLSTTGFSSVYECHIPEEQGKPEDRFTLLAIKKKRLNPSGCPQLEERYAGEISELIPADSFQSISDPPPYLILRKILPVWLKTFIKKILTADSKGKNP
jgi:2-polyprenyl-3-methyl-5-hydroxy-6-metoxy-1,4-benzoquinol methylase